MITCRHLLFCVLLGAACAEDEPEERTREEFCQDWAAAVCSDEVVDVCHAEGPEKC